VGFIGIRQDSGEPASFANITRDFYKEEGIKDAKTIVFSDSQHPTLSEVQKDYRRAGLKVQLWCRNFLYK
jgi:nicotinic acid phosphoribosyltransferase